MAFKQKIIGFLLVLIGILPFLLKLDYITSYFSKYTFLPYLAPGDIFYQAIIILLGILLVVEFNPRPKRQS
ncbi:MAG: hypothetical protein PHF67_02050 [Candidatus Nanoarchaeia archaeon]|nr:hypothetical protein [Candidatus Nanoarchaeia archaeon]